LAVLGLGIGFVQGTLFVQDIWELPQQTTLLWDVRLAIYWLIWSLLIGSVMELSKERSDILAVWTGFCFGSVASALMWCKAESDSFHRGRSIFLSILGAGFHPFGILGGISIWSQVEGQLLHHILAWIPIFVVGSVLLKTEWNFEVNTQVSSYVGALLTMILLYLVPNPEWVLLASAVIFSALKWKVLLQQDFKYLGKILAVALLSFWVVNLSVAAGLAELLTWGMEDAPEMLRPYIVPLLNVGGVLTAALIGQWSMGIFIVGVQERLLDISAQHFMWMPMALALGGCFPFWISQSFKPIWKTFVLWMGLGAVYLLALSLLF